MSKTSKLLLVFLGIGLAVAIVFFVLVNSVYKPPEVVITYPRGSLSDSFMAASATKYTKSADLPKTYNYNHPYSVDVPDVVSASVGNGKVFQITEGVLMYVTEFNGSTNIQAVIQSELPQAILMNYDPKFTKVVAQHDRTGFTNGFAAEYIADKIAVSDGKNVKESALMGYVYTLDGDYSGGYIFVGVCTTVITQSEIDAVYAYLDAASKTVRFNAARDSEIRAEYAKSQQATQGSASQQSGSSTDGQGQNNGSSGQGGSSGDSSSAGSSIQSTEFEVAKDYTKLTVEVTWTLSDPAAVCELWYPDGEAFASPVSQSSTSAKFVLDKVPRGKYVLKMKGNIGDAKVAPSGELAPAS